jgi:AcrR family transcriptional regulator
MNAPVRSRPDLPRAPRRGAPVGERSGPVRGTEPSGRTHRRAEETLRAAAEVFASRGYHGATTQEIADLLGIRQASLYYYFRSKEAALEAVCLRGVEGYVDAAEAVVRGGGSVPQRIAGLIGAHLAPLQDRRAFVHVFLKERQYLPPDGRRKVGRLSRRYERIIEALVAEGVSDGSLAPGLDPRTVTLAVLGMCNAVVDWVGREPGLDVPTIVGRYAAIATDGLAARARAPVGGRRAARKG